MSPSEVPGKVAPIGHGIVLGDRLQPRAMPATGTNAELTNTIGKIRVNTAAWTASTSLSNRPTVAEIQRT